MKIRKSLAGVVVLFAAALPVLSLAQGYPSRPIRFIVPFTPS